jgi:hypothetical protein
MVPMVLSPEDGPCARDTASARGAAEPCAAAAGVCRSPFLSIAGPSQPATPSPHGPTAMLMKVPGVHAGTGLLVGEAPSARTSSSGPKQIAASLGRRLIAVTELRKSSAAGADADPIGVSRSHAKATAVHNPPSYRLSSYALSAVARSRLEGELGPYLYLWMREDHPGPGEKTSMRSPSGSKTKNA